MKDCIKGKVESKAAVQDKELYEMQREKSLKLLIKMCHLDSNLGRGRSTGPTVFLNMVKLHSVTI